MVSRCEEFSSSVEIAGKLFQQGPRTFGLSDSLLEFSKQTKIPKNIMAPALSALTLGVKFPGPFFCRKFRKPILWVLI